jgi:ribosomal protein S1
MPDPWQSTVADLKVGDLVDGTVTKIVNFGAFVRVRDGLEGLIHISELSHQRVAHPGDVVHEGQTIKLKVISLDSERHRLGLSLKQAEEAPARPARERRPRVERAGYDRAQAIQEPEGGIDNTLAAAFAQVRQQIAEQDAAQAGDEAPVAQASDDEAPAEAVDLAPAELEAAAEVVGETAQAEEAEASGQVEEAVAEVAEDEAKTEEAEAVAEVADQATEDVTAEAAEDVTAEVESEVDPEDEAPKE